MNKKTSYNSYILEDNTESFNKCHICDKYCDINDEEQVTKLIIKYHHQKQSHFSWIKSLFSIEPQRIFYICTYCDNLYKISPLL